MAADQNVSAEHINAIMMVVRQQSPDDGDAQLSALVLAVVALCKSWEVPKHDALRLIRQAFNTPMQMSETAPGMH